MEHGDRDLALEQGDMDLAVEQGNLARALQKHADDETLMPEKRGMKQALTGTPEAYGLIAMKPPGTITENIQRYQ